LELISVPLWGVPNEDTEEFLPPPKGYISW